MENDSKIEKKNYIFDVAQWLFDCFRIIYEFQKEQPFPRRKDYQEGSKTRIDTRPGEPSPSDIETRNGQPD